MAMVATRHWRHSALTPNKARRSFAIALNVFRYMMSRYAHTILLLLMILSGGRFREAKTHLLMGFLDVCWQSVRTQIRRIQ